MLIWGYLGDVFGRKWGSRIVAAIMLSGCILLTFTPFATTDPNDGYKYLTFFIVSETWYVPPRVSPLLACPRPLYASV